MGIEQYHEITFYEKYIKRVFDFCVALIASIVLLPIIIIVAFLVKIKLGSPIIFKQKRPGLHEEIFTMYKFRTMSDARDKQGNLLPDKVRLTEFGLFLRRTSLDELPELINILKGDLSICGPRPLAVQYLPFYTEVEHHRHDVRPGLSGLAQINGRNDIQWEERFAYDLAYIKKITFLGDIKIIFLTIKKALKKEGVVIRGTGKTIDFDSYRKQQKEK